MNSNLFSSNLQYANCNNSNFDNSNLAKVNFEGANIFSSSFKKGFNLYLGLEREELSYASASKNLGEAEVLTTDGGKYIRPTKSTLLWITSGIEYNFSIWNKQSALSLLVSYSVYGTSQTQDTSEKTSYWENIAGYKLYCDYKQHLTKSIWTNLYSRGKEIFRRKKKQDY